MTEKQMSRKTFIKGMGTSIAGVAAVGAFGGLLNGCAAEDASGMDAVKYPLKYKKLDPAVAEERAYNAYFEQGG